MKYISLFFLLLTACSIDKFDAIEYKKYVDAATTLDIDLCTAIPDKTQLLTNAMQLRKKLDWLVVYAGSKPSDNDSLTIIKQITKENQRFIALLNTDISLKSNISQIYCQRKIENIRHAFTELLN